MKKVFIFGAVFIGKLLIYAAADAASDWLDGRRGGD